MTIFGRRPQKAPSFRISELRRMSMTSTRYERRTRYSQTKKRCHVLLIVLFIISMFLLAITLTFHGASTDIAIIGSPSLRLKKALFVNGTTTIEGDSKIIKTATSIAPNNSINNINNTEQLLYPSSEIYITGIIVDATKIHKLVWKTILLLNCKYGYGIHILAKKGVDDAMAMRHDFFDILFRDTENGGTHETSCAPFVIHREDADELSSIFDPKHASLLLDSHYNRIDRISMMRDYQRSLLRPIFSTGSLLSEVENGKIDNRSITNNHREKTGIVILLDFDLHGMPNVETLVNQVEHLQQPSYPHDVVCAAGITRAKRNQLWYYDTFATVMLPDTFVHPLKRRLMPHLYPGENSTHVRSDNIQGEVTQGDIMEYFVAEGKKSSSGAVSVKSCFGGLALYRADVYFTKSCQYQLDAAVVDLNKDNLTSIMRYANSVEGRPCEHVVFHDCLKKVIEKRVDIALNPELRTMWGRNMRPKL